MCGIARLPGDPPSGVFFARKHCRRTENFLGAVRHFFDDHKLIVALFRPSLMKIALAQFNPTVGDFDGNSTRILELAREARRRGAEIAVFSELCLCGYPPQDLIERPAFVERNQETWCASPNRTAPVACRLCRQCAGQYRQACRQFRGPDRPRKDPLRAAQDAAAHLRCLRRVALLPARALPSTPFFWAPKPSASPFAKISGTTRTSGRSASMTATR